MCVCVCVCVCDCVFKNSTLYTSKQLLMMAYEGTESARNNFGKFIYQFQPETKTLIRKLERILNKLYRQNFSLLLNETCLNERLLPNYTHTHTHTYICVCVCVCTCVCVFVSSCWYNDDIIKYATISSEYCTFFKYMELIIMQLTWGDEKTFIFTQFYHVLQVSIWALLWFKEEILVLGNSVYSCT